MFALSWFVGVSFARLRWVWPLIVCLMITGTTAFANAQTPSGAGAAVAKERDVLQAPLGGRAIAIGEARVACPAQIDLRGWTVEADGRSVKPPAAGGLVGAAVILPVAAAGSHCANPSATVELVAIGSVPTVDAATIVLDVDAAQLTFQGRGLRGAVLLWSSGDKSGTDVCNEPQTSAGIDSCTLGVMRGLPADPGQLSLTLLPAGSRSGATVYTYDVYALLVRPEARVLRPARVVVAQLLRPAAALELQSGATRLTLLHPEAIASLDCEDAFCAIDGTEVLVRAEHGGNDTLELQFRLRPHIFLRRGAATEAAPRVDVPIQRCPVALIGPPLLRGIGDQALVLRLGGRCTDDPSLQFFSTSGRVTVERRELLGGERYVVLRLDRTNADEVGVTVRSAGATVGVVSARTGPAPALRTQLSLPGAGTGAIDFIPTNRDAQLQVMGADNHSRFVPLPVDGAYTVSTATDGHPLVRGVEGSTGAVGLRFAYRDPTLPPTLRDITLATVNDPVARSLHAANVPLALEADAKSEHPFIELLCEDGGKPGSFRRLRSGVTEQLPYRARDTCRLVLHRDRLLVADGTQALQVTIEVTAADGTARSDAKVDQRVIVKPGPADKPRTITISGVSSPFDRVVVHVNVLADDVHYAALPDDKLGAQLQWTLVMGTGHFRLYATTAIPTGLYRVADQGHQGILTLNAGAVLRLVLLSKEGKESPLGLESGLMWLGITGDSSPDPSAHGEFAVVAGLGLGIPIANQARASQTSISLHAWFEYEVTRALRPNAGIPYGFVFGPSITVGDAGFNF